MLVKKSEPNLPSVLLFLETIYVGRCAIRCRSFGSSMHSVLYKKRSALGFAPETFPLRGCTAHQRVDVSRWRPFGISPCSRPNGNLTNLYADLRKAGALAVPSQQCTYLDVHQTLNCRHRREKRMESYCLFALLCTDHSLLRKTGDSKWASIQEQHGHNFLPETHPVREGGGGGVHTQNENQEGVSRSQQLDVYSQNTSTS